MTRAKTSNPVDISIYWVRVWIGNLEQFAPNGNWRTNPLVRQWYDKRQRALISDEDYARLDTYLANCWQRVYECKFMPKD